MVISRPWFELGTMLPLTYYYRYSPTPSLTIESATFYDDPGDKPHLRWIVNR